jgi:hypothetical protein
MKKVSKHITYHSGLLETLQQITRLVHIGELVKNHSKYQSRSD